MLLDFMLPNGEGLVGDVGAALASATMRVWSSLLGEKEAGQQVRL